MRRVFWVANPSAAYPEETGKPEPLGDVDYATLSPLQLVAVHDRLDTDTLCRYVVQVVRARGGGTAALWGSSGSR